MADGENPWAFPEPLARQVGLPGAIGAEDIEHLRLGGSERLGAALDAEGTVPGLIVALSGLLDESAVTDEVSEVVIRDPGAGRGQFAKRIGTLPGDGPDARGEFSLNCRGIARKPDEIEIRTALQEFQRDVLLVAAESAALELVEDDLLRLDPRMGMAALPASETGRQRMKEILEGLAHHFTTFAKTSTFCRNRSAKQRFSWASNGKASSALARPRRLMRIRR